MKLLVSFVVIFFSFVAMASAAPITDFSQGKGAIDVGYGLSNDVTLSDSEGSSDVDMDSNWNAGITYGLGNNFALQYKFNKAETKTYNFEDGSAKGKLTANEFNVLYKFDKNFAGFIGFTNAKADLDGYDGVDYVSIDGKGHNMFQVGLQTVAPLGDKLNGFAVVSGGNDIFCYELGLAYAASENVDINLSYKSVDYKDLGFEGSSFKYEYEVKGPQLGITYKF